MLENRRRVLNALGGLYFLGQSGYKLQPIELLDQLFRHRLYLTYGSDQLFVETSDSFQRRLPQSLQFPRIIDSDDLKDKFKVVLLQFWWIALND